MNGKYIAGGGLVLIISLILAYSAGAHSVKSDSNQIADMMVHHYRYAIKGNCMSDFPIQRGEYCFTK